MSHFYPASQKLRLRKKNSSRFMRFLVAISLPILVSQEQTCWNFRNKFDSRIQFHGTTRIIFGLCALNSLINSLMGIPNSCKGNLCRKISVSPGEHNGTTASLKWYHLLLHGYSFPIITQKESWPWKNSSVARKSWICWHQRV